jgi:two-component system, cell cycle sensor histidine kinase and response regulator CckA
VERTLRISEANYQAIFDAVGDGIWVLDPATGSTLDANRTACDMLGLPRASMIGRPFSAIAREFGCEDIAEALQDGLSVPFREWECPVRDRGGRLFWSEVRASQTEIGEQKRLLVVMREVTDRKEAEQEKQRLEQRLVQSQKMEALGQLAGGIAHDFNNILTGITLAAEVALLKSGASPALSSGVRQIKELAGRATALTQQMLTFSRRQPLRTGPVHLNELVAPALSMLHRLIGEDINLTFTPGTDRDLIRADRGQIEQVLVNLAVNARDAMPAGGDLRIATRLEVGGKGLAQSLPAGEYVVLEVADTGHGMDEKTRERIFEPFFTTKAVGKGTGLGLAMVYGIATRHGATIAVDSEPGCGTALRICFPVLESGEEAVVLETPTSAAAPRGTELILILEDNPDVRRLLEANLKELGYRTVSAESPAQAEPIYRARRRELALLLSDVVMPGESGPQFYRRMAREDPGLKVVFMSGYADARSGCEEVVREGLPFIQKPFATSDLGRLIRDTLDGVRPQPVPVAGPIAG